MGSLMEKFSYPEFQGHLYHGNSRFSQKKGRLKPGIFDRRFFFKNNVTFLRWEKNDPKSRVVNVTSNVWG